MFDKLIEAIKKAERVVEELILLVSAIGSLLLIIKAIIESLF